MNVVRSKVKEGKKDELMKKFKEFFDNMKGTDGLISMKLIQTGPNNMCTIGEWKDEQSIAKARDKMIAGLETTISDKDKFLEKVIEDYKLDIKKIKSSKAWKVLKKLDSFRKDA